MIFKVIWKIIWKTFNLGYPMPTRQKNKLSIKYSYKLFPILISKLSSLVHKFQPTCLILSDLNKMYYLRSLKPLLLHLLLVLFRSSERILASLQTTARSVTFEVWECASSSTAYPHRMTAPNWIWLTMWKRRWMRERMTKWKRLGWWEVPEWCDALMASVPIICR